MHDDLLKLAAHAGCLAIMVILLTTQGAKGLEHTEEFIAGVTQSAAIFFVPSITTAQIQDDYAASTGGSLALATQGAHVAEKKVRILIVPGHQPDKNGTEFGDVKERDVVVDIANALADLLGRNPHYEVTVARGKTAWNPILQSYFDTHAAEIETFQKSQAAQMANHLADGSVLLSADQVYHHDTAAPAALQLYGINKWASENNVDITLHLHINDFAGRRPGAVGKYDGFTVYVPEHQYSNAAASKPIGVAIANRLNAYHATSTFPREDQGVVEDQELIAIGSNNTADNAALLIEYGYIYEPQFLKASVRPVAIADYAYQTYLGLQDFFNDPIGSTYGSVSFPYDWNKVTVTDGTAGAGVYALQAALHHLGFYPPAGKSLSDCPVSGVAGPCSLDALKAYQLSHGLDGTGVLGPLTRVALEQDLTKP